MKDDKYRKYKVYYFIGDYWSSQGETRRCTTIRARSEEEAEDLFKLMYPIHNFGWVDEYRTSRN